MASSDLARLPSELLAEIVSIAAWELAEVDKPWLASIALTSQLILHTVRPILYHTVLLTAVNHDAIIECAYSGNFTLTRRLWISKPPASLALVAAVFAHVEHLSATSALYTTLRTVHAPLNPRMLTQRGHGDAQLERFVTAVTHLHLAGEPHARLSARPADLALRFVLLDSMAPGWNTLRLVGTILPFFLSCPALERVLVRAPTHDRSTKATRDALAEYAAVHAERRLWFLDTPTDGKLLSLFRPGVTFDPLKWTRGRQVLPTRKDDA